MNIRTLTSNLFSKKVRILGRSIPIATVALAVTFVAAFAWTALFIFAARFAVTTTSANVQPVALGSWVCSVAGGTGATITTCAERSGSNGPEIVVAGLSEDNLFVQAYRSYQNPNASVPYTVTMAGAQNAKLPVCISTDAGVCLPGGQTIPGGGTAIVYLAVKSAGIGPNESLDVLLDMSWAP